MAGSQAATVGGAANVRTRRGVAGWFRRHSFEIALVTPLIAYILVLTVAPIIDTFRLSFSTAKGGFGTLASYREVFKDPVFRHAIINTIIVALLSLTLEVTVGLAIALA